MWRWRPTRCPVETGEKTWIESRMRWLADRFGIDRLIRAELLLPTAEHFPEPYSGTEADARRFMQRICRMMGLHATDITLEICPDDQMDGAAGLYYHQSEGERATIQVAESQLADPLRLVSVLAHELSHELLYGRGLIHHEAPDFEWLTDLAPVFFGLGIFSANSTITEFREWRTNLGTRTVRQHGYLPSRMFGYALALFAFMRKETRPAWAGMLRLDASVTFERALRFLERGGETLFHPDTVRVARRSLSASVAADRLREGSASVRLATLWEIRELRLKDPALIPEIECRLTDSDSAIPADAALALALFRSQASSAVPQLVASLAVPDEALKECAAFALGEIGGEPHLVIPALVDLLADQPNEVIRSAALALARFGHAAEISVAPLLAALRVTLVDCNQPLADDLADVLRAVCADPIGRAEALFGTDDPELARLVILTLQLPPEETNGSSGEASDPRPAPSGPGDQNRPGL